MAWMRETMLRLQEQRARGTTTLRRVQEERGPNSLLAAAVEAVELDRQRAGGLIAGGVAFRAFLWLLPTALVASGALGVLQDAAHENPDVVARKLGLGGVVASSVAGAANQSSRSTFLLIAFGLVLMLYFGVSLVRALRIACVVAWELPLGRRPHLLRDGVIISLALVRSSRREGSPRPCAATRSATSGSRSPPRPSRAQSGSASPHCCHTATRRSRRSCPAR